MSVKAYKPTTPARRGMTTQDFSDLENKTSPKKLRSVKKQKSGRNNSGRITVRHRGGGAKKFYRNVNFALAEGTQAKVIAIEYDPNRSARIALIKDQDNNLHYILASAKMKVGQTIESGPEAAIEAGNRLKLAAIPTGSFIHNIEMTVGKGGQLVRSAGNGAQLMAKDEQYAQIKLPSGEVRLVNVNCQATLDSVGNVQHQNIKLGSAGRRRRQGWRPSVRGKAMNAADHPHGGGDGGAHGVGREPKTPTGQKTLGYKTRRRKSSNNLIIRSRHASKRA